MNTDIRPAFVLLPAELNALRQTAARNGVVINEGGIDSPDVRTIRGAVVPSPATEPTRASARAGCALPAGTVRRVT